jgi:hypothetical protein
MIGHHKSNLCVLFRSRRDIVKRRTGDEIQASYQPIIP